MTVENDYTRIGTEYAAARQAGDRSALLRLLTPDFQFQDPAYAYGHARREAFIDLAVEHAQSLIGPEYIRIGPILFDEAAQEVGMRWLCHAHVQVEGEQRKVSFETAEFSAIRGGRVCRTTIFTRDLIRRTPLDGSAEVE